MKFWTFSKRTFRAEKSRRVFDKILHLPPPKKKMFNSCCCNGKSKKVRIICPPSRNLALDLWKYENYTDMEGFM